MKWTEKFVQKLKEQGRIVSYVIHGKKKKLPAAARKGKGDKEKAKLAWAIKCWCLEQGLKMETEFRFHDERLWRFDFAIRALKIAIEYEGILSEKSRHTTVAGYSGDADKYNAAAAAGWTVIRFTALNCGNVTETLNACVSKR